MTATAMPETATIPATLPSVVNMTPVSNTLIAGEPPSMQIIPAPSLLPSAHEYKVYLDLADQMHKSGFFPAAVKTPAQALAIMLTGREIGVPPMMALRMIHVIDGKPGMSAELMLARFKRAGGKFEWVATDARIATISMCPPGSSRWTPFTFTIEEAKAAEVTGKANWKKYPAAMLRARVATLAVRAVAPEVSAGFYDADELGAETNEAGEIEAWPEQGRETSEPPDARRSPSAQPSVQRNGPPPSSAKPNADDPVLPLAQLLKDNIPLSDPRCGVGEIVAFLALAAKDDASVAKHGALIQKAWSVFPLKLQDAPLEKLTNVRNWIVKDEGRTKLLRDWLTKIETRMEDINAMSTSDAAYAAAASERDRARGASTDSASSSDGAIDDASIGIDDGGAGDDEDRP